MRTQRYKTSRDLPMDEVFPTRPGLCCKCSMPLKGKQTRWCSKKCADEAFSEVMVLRGNSTYIRRALEKRDQGICAGCGLDTQLLGRILHRAYWSLQQYGFPFTSAELICKVTGFTPYRHFWEADHIIEVARGGEHSLDNLQTLCIECHKEKTKCFVSRPAKALQ